MKYLPALIAVTLSCSEHKDGIAHNRDTGRSGDSVDTDTEEGDTDLSIDTAKACEDVVEEVSLNDRSLGFTVSDILLEMASSPYGSVTWTALPEGATATESLSFPCSESATQALLLTRLDNADVGEVDCPPGPELYALVDCVIQIDGDGIVGDGEATIGGPSLSMMNIGFSDSELTLDTEHSVLAAGESSYGEPAPIDSAIVEVFGKVSDPTISVLIQSNHSLSVTWDGTIRQASP